MAAPSTEASSSVRRTSAASMMPMSRPPQMGYLPLRTAVEHVVGLARRLLLGAGVSTPHYAKGMQQTRLLWADA